MFGLPNPYLIGGAVLILVVATGGGYLQGRADGRDKEVARQAKVTEIVAATRAAAIVAAAEEIAKIEVRHVTIKQNLTKEVVKEPVYIECRHTPDGLRYLNQALTDGQEPAPRGLVPTPNPTGG